MSSAPHVASVADLRTLVASMPGPDEAARRRVRERDAQLTKPPGSLGRLEELAAWLAAWQGGAPPRADRLVARVFAGSHGVTARGVSAYPAEVTGQMVGNFAAGGAAVNQLCALRGIELEVVDLGWRRPTADLTVAPALTGAELLEAVGRGLDAVPDGADVLAVGEMGIGNTTSAAAVLAALAGEPAAAWVGRGTGVDDAGLARKVEVVAAALDHHRDHLADPLEVLRRLGGREVAALAGAVLGARLRRVPVVLDGFVTAAAAAVLHALDPSALDHCVAGHVSAEAGHRRALDRLGLVPLVDLGLRLGEASGAVLALGIVEAAVATHTGMATFAEAGVSGA